MITDIDRAAAATRMGRLLKHGATFWGRRSVPAMGAMVGAAMALIASSGAQAKVELSSDQVAIDSAYTEMVSRVADQIANHPEIGRHTILFDATREVDVSRLDALTAPRFGAALRGEPLNLDTSPICTIVLNSPSAASHIDYLAGLGSLPISEKIGDLMSYRTAIAVQVGAEAGRCLQGERAEQLATDSLVGRNANQRVSFATAALFAIQNGASQEAIEHLADLQQASLQHVAYDSHSTVRAVLRDYTALKGDPTFMGLDIVQTSHIAATYAAVTQPDFRQVRQRQHAIEDIADALDDPAALTGNTKSIELALQRDAAVQRLGLVAEPASLATAIAQPEALTAFRAAPPKTSALPQPGSLRAAWHVAPVGARVAPVVATDNAPRFEVTLGSYIEADGATAQQAMANVVRDLDTGGLLGARWEPVDVALAGQQQTSVLPNLASRQQAVMADAGETHQIAPNRWSLMLVSKLVVEGPSATDAVNHAVKMVTGKAINGNMLLADQAPTAKLQVAAAAGKPANRDRPRPRP